MSKIKKLLTAPIKPLYLFAGVLAIAILIYFFADIKYVPSFLLAPQSSRTEPPTSVKISAASLVATAASTTNNLTEEADEDEFDSTTFTRENADSRLEQISQALMSFNHFTELVRAKSNLNKDYGLQLIDPKRIPKNARINIQFAGEDLIEVGNLDWETQNLGFANWPKSIRGYMDYQAYEIAKLKLVIATLKKQSADEINALEQDVKQKEKYLRDVYMSPDAWAD